jgi:hypothetical protein
MQKKRTVAVFQRKDQMQNGLQSLANLPRFPQKIGHNQSVSIK